jgi:tRNA-dihydrouridine synthase
MHNPWLFGQIADAWEGLKPKEISATEALDVFPLYFKFKLEDGSTELGAMGRLKQLAARLCKGFCLDEREAVASECHPGAEGDRIQDLNDAEQDVAMQVRQALLTAQTAEEFFDRLQALREGVAKKLRYDPNRLVNLNGAKETELRFGDQFLGR